MKKKTASKSKSASNSNALPSWLPSIVAETVTWADTVSLEVRQKAIEVLTSAKEQIEDFLPGPLSNGGKERTGQKRRKQKDLLAHLGSSKTLHKIDASYRQLQGAIEESLKSSMKVVSDKASDFLDIPSRKEVQKLHDQLDEISQRLENYTNRH